MFSEFRRTFRKKNIVLLMLLMFVNVGIFSLSADQEKKITLTGEELAAYIDGYQDFVESAIRQARLRADMDLYADGFSASYLRKSIGRYTALRGVRPVYGENRGVVLYLQYHLSECFVLIFLFCVVTDFFEDRKKGLDKLIRSTARGRGRLFLKRIGVLLCAAFLGTGLIYGTCFASLSLSFGWGDLSRSIQSLPEYMSCPYTMSIGEYLSVSCFVRGAAFFLAGLFFYVLYDVCGKLIACVLGAVVIALETVSALSIASVSAFNIFKYINLVTLLRLEDFFDRCVFVNVFGQAVDGALAAVVALVAVSFLMAAAGLLIQGKRYVNEDYGGGKWLHTLRRWKEKLSIPKGIVVWEMHKLFITQGAFFFLLAALGIHSYMSLRYDYIYPVNEFEKMDYIKYNGEIDEEKKLRIEAEIQAATDSIEHMEGLLKKEESKENKNTYFIFQLQSSIADEKYRLLWLDKTAGDVRSGYEYYLRTGKMVQLVEPYAYEIYLQRDVQTKRRAYFLGMIAIIAGISGIYAFDRQNNMTSYIRATYRGRKVQRLIKPALAIFFGMIALILLHLVQLVHLNMSYGFPDISAPLQSLPFMRTSPLHVSIVGYLILLFLVRALCGGGVALLSASISRLSRDRFTALGVSVFLFIAAMLLPSIIPGLS